MSPEEENGKLLKSISHQVGKTHEGLVRVEERLVNLNDRVTKLDKNIEIVRTTQQQAGTEVALIQAENVRHRKSISNIHHKVEALGNNVGAVEHTGRMFIAQTTQTWKVVAITGGIFAVIAAIAVGIAKVLYG
jgi:chromosome segregation ATPase